MAEQVLGGIPLGFGMLWKINLLFHVSNLFVYFFQDDLTLKEDHLFDIATNKPLPKDFYLSGSPTILPGLPAKTTFGESRVINYIMHVLDPPITA